MTNPFLDLEFLTFVSDQTGLMVAVIVLLAILGVMGLVVFKQNIKIEKLYTNPDIPLSSLLKENNRLRELNNNLKQEHLNTLRNHNQEKVEYEKKIAEQNSVIQSQASHIEFLLQERNLILDAIKDKISLFDSDSSEYNEKLINNLASSLEKYTKTKNHNQ